MFIINKHKYDSKAKMLVTHTDRLMYKKEAENVMKTSTKDKELFVFSNYPKDSTHHYGANNLAVGKMEYETSGAPIVGLYRIDIISFFLMMI